MRLVPIDELKVNSELAIDILDEYSNVLIAKGRILNEMNIERLITTNVVSVYIKDQYCCNDNVQYTSEPSNVIDKVAILKDAIYAAACGELRGDDIAFALRTINQTVSELEARKYTQKITYERNKIRVEVLDEKMIYIAMMSSLFALKLGFSKQRTSLICLGALLRDVVAVVPKFAGQEDSFSKLHPIKGYNYVKEKYNFPEEVLQIILQHHELYDGKGFPYGLKGNEICEGARIVAIIDMFYKINTMNMTKNSKTMQEDFMKWTSHLDPIYLEQFLKHVSMFAPDTLVKLTNGDVAVVMPTKVSNPFKPQVKIIRSYTFQPGILINLNEYPDLHIYRVVYYV
ncbi:MAG: hypothetical protein ATN33_03190 [Epulopiscium sp. Nele67-Bin001]|nr:MAG: hypothetical protein BEN18_08260 [Epulopiscium sp. Nuni2H_MBin001]OON90367.1 MAG: hypothetical protein ATN33_03190 [Epulopiscium sp. Nele67-Bin001]